MNLYENDTHSSLHAVVYNFKRKVNFRHVLPSEFLKVTVGGPSFGSNIEINLEIIEFLFKHVVLAVHFTVGL